MKFTWLHIMSLGITLLFMPMALIANKEEAISLINELNQVHASVKQYNKDTGKVLPITSDTKITYGYLKIDNLIKNPGLKGWNGPYLSYEDDFWKKEQYVSHPIYSNIYILAKENVKWNKGSDSTGCKQSSSNCFIAACAWGVPSEVTKKINYLIDGIKNENSEDSVGKVRYNDSIVCIVADVYPKENSPVK